jgi:hypothetical protein
MSYLRRGMARSIGGEAKASGVPTGADATIDIRVQTADTVITRSFAPLSPGAITGLAAGEVLRVDPPADSADHPPNLFPSVELRTPDLPWRYTPAQPNRENLMPWLVLVVVPERSGINLNAGVPLSVLSVDDAGELPDLHEAWAWAHVQSGVDDDDLDRVLEQTPEALWARLLCARYLESDTPYLACVVPSFEAGRLAGLGMSSTDVAVDALAWSSTSGEVALPVYHYWRFRTAAQGADFEELVRRLAPITLSPDVGVRELDLSDPGSERLPKSAAPVGYQGALVSPRLDVPPWDDPQRVRFQLAIGRLLAEATPGEPLEPGERYDPLRHDPVVAPPAYGLLPAGVDAVPQPRQPVTWLSPRWLSEVNLDPAARAVAGVGTEVVRRNQERLMAEAWNQAGGVQAVNRLLNQTRLAREVGRRRHQRAELLAPASVLQFSAGAHARLSGGSGQTVHGVVRGSDLPRGSVSAALRRSLRPAGIFAKAMRSPSARGARIDVTRRFTDRVVNQTSAILAYADLTVPHGCVLSSGDVVTSEDGPLLDRPSATPTDFGEWTATHLEPLQANLRRTRTPGAARLRRRFAAPQARTTSAAMVSTSPRPLTVEEPVAVAQTVLTDSQLLVDTRPVDSVYGGVDHVLTGSGAVSETAETFDLHAVAASINSQLDATELLAARLRHVIEPAGVLGSEPVPSALQAAPSIQDPLYADVVRIDPELLMPGVSGLPDEVVGLAAVNAAHVETFLLGANHELAREMLWREYPADLTGTWLPAFWDRTAAGGSGDIAAIADWKPSALGTHEAAGTDPGQMLVLIVKGELLRRYPDTLITAVPARWREQDGKVLREEDPEQSVLTPAFVGRLSRNVAFVGFEFPPTVNLAHDVKGSTDPDDGVPGWYFAFEQPATEPRFGLDTAASDSSPDLEYWKDLTWADARSNGAPYVQLEVLDVTLPYDHRGENQWSETWAESAAAMARITLQRPVRMLVHADQMLATDESA